MEVVGEGRVAVAAEGTLGGQRAVLDAHTDAGMDEKGKVDTKTEEVGTPSSQTGQQLGCPPGVSHVVGLYGGQIWTWTEKTE